MGRPYEHQIQRYVMQPGETRCTCADAVLPALSRKGSPCFTPAHARCSPLAVDERNAKFMVMLNRSCCHFLQVGVADEKYKSYQVHFDQMYYGETSPLATSEVPHYHYGQLEAYTILAGEVEVWAK